MKTLFVTATNTNVGKTYTTIKLIESLAQQGISVGVCKPIETGVEKEPLDAKALLEAVQQYNKNFETLKAKDITAYTFSLPSAPFSADIHKEIKIQEIKNKIYKLKEKCDILIIEGAGGLLVPITKEYQMIDLAQELDSMVLLVTPSKLGCINDTLLSIEALEHRKIKFDWTVNLFEDRDSFSEVTQPFYNEAFPNWWTVQNSLDSFIEKLIKS